jgi:ankyrin repeat protein
MSLREKKIFKYKTRLKSFKSEESKFKLDNREKNLDLNKDYNNYNSLFDNRMSSKRKIMKRNDLIIKRLNSVKMSLEKRRLKLHIKDNLENDSKSRKNKNNKYRYIKNEEKETEDKNNIVNNISIYSTQCANDEKIQRFQKEFYCIDNKEKEKRRINLLKTSYHFNKYNNDRAIIRMINRFKNKEELEFAQRETKRKYSQFSYTKRIRTKIAFGKGKSNNEISEIDNNYNFNKKRKQQKIKKRKNTEKLKDIFNNGYNLKTEYNYLKNNNKITYSDIKKEIFITNSNLEKVSPRDCFGNIIYPILTKHKILKNILPNEVDYNTKTSIVDIINSEIHPLLRFQKKIMTQSSNLISQELNVLFSKFMCLSRIEPDKENELKRKDNLIELSKDEKFIQLMRGLIGKDKEMEKKLKDKINEEEKKKKLIRRKYLLKKFKEIILNACQKIKKYNIDIDIFYSLMEINKNDETFKKEYVNKGQYLFRVIKAGDINEIINVINQNNYLVSYKDEFDQIPLHICAKRNIYQIIAFLLSRLSPIDAQDESGRTALMIAAHYNYLEFVTILLFENANPKIKDINLKKASDLTTNEKIKIILKRAEALHNLHLFIEGKNLQKFVVNGLDFLYKKELEINYEKWINQGIKIVKDSQQSFI